MLRRTTSQQLCAKLETNKCNTFAIIYKLLKLILLLSVRTTSVERVFSAMKVVNSQLCNKMGDQWLNNRLVYRNRFFFFFFITISNYIILLHFQQMNKRQFSL